MHSRLYKAKKKFPCLAVDGIHIKRELKHTMRECVGKTNTRLEVKCSDCAPGKIPELAANAQLPFLL